MENNRRREARILAGFKTQKAYAEYLGRHPSNITNIENGYYEPPAWYDRLLEALVELKRLKGEL